MLLTHGCVAAEAAPRQRWGPGRCGVHVWGAGWGGFPPRSAAPAPQVGHPPPRERDALACFQFMPFHPWEQVERALALAGGCRSG